MKKQHPLVSVVIPIYNAAATLLDCLSSVLAQSYTHTEIICVNDGSTDQSMALLAKLRDPRIRVINQVNRGLAGARNTGINAATGELIALLDADDAWFADKLERHVAHFQRDPELGISYSGSRFMDTHGNDMGLGQQPQLHNITKLTVLCKNPIGNGSAPVIRRQVFADIAHRQFIDLGDNRLSYFDETLRQSEDIACWLKVALETSWRIAGLAGVDTWYRINNDGLSANIDAQLASWRNAMMKLFEQHPAFFMRWLDHGEAYQFRYLARRAVNSGQGKQACALLAQAFIKHPALLIREPKRTLATLAGAILALLPNAIFAKIKGVVFSAHRQCNGSLST